MPFESHKNAKQLGIDLTRKFIVVAKTASCSPEVGDILEIRRDDGSPMPYFWNLTANRNDNPKHETENKWTGCARWSQLEYYDEVKLNKPTGNKFMSTILNAFKSKEDKALEHFNLGTTKELNENGRKEFIDYVYETGDTSKKGFLAKIVEVYNGLKKQD